MIGKEWSGCSARLRNILAWEVRDGRLPDYSLQSVASRTRVEWARVPHCGSTTLAEMGRVLADHGLFLEHGGNHPISKDGLPKRIASARKAVSFFKERLASAEEKLARLEARQ